MKKYKLIKKYPGSYSVGVVLTKERHAPFYGINKADIHEDIIENYPEFWELVVEKDYEILSLRSLDIIEDLENNETINMLLKQGCSIHSVKRLSDGEIFTIGDKISPSWNNTTWNITKFDTKSKDGTLCVTFGGNVCRCSINDIKKPKQPLFTTEDGVDIFEGDKYYPVNKTYWIVNEPENTCKINYETYHKNTNNFSTKEKAEEYILMNKPILSLNDIFKNVEEMRKGLKTFENSQLAKRFKKLVQQKLNNKN